MIDKNMVFYEQEANQIMVLFQFKNHRIFKDITYPLHIK